MPKPQPTAEREAKQIPAKVEDIQAQNISGDFFVGSDCVKKLSRQHFTDFITKKDVSLVLFYDPTIKDCVLAKNQFNCAANHMKNETRRVYGAVNCADEPLLCSEEQVVHVPFFKMFSRGRTINTFCDHNTFTATEMVKNMKRVHILPDQPAGSKPC